VPRSRILKLLGLSLIGCAATGCVGKCEGNTQFMLINVLIPALFIFGVIYVLNDQN
jgi:hypothetical protein